MIKRAEHFWKGLSSNKEEISAVPPDAYGDRFFRFVSKIIKVETPSEQAAAEQRGIAGENFDGLTDAELVLEAQVPDRKLTTIRSTSDNGDAPQQGSTILPVVEENGESGSSIGRTNSDADGAAVNGGSYHNHQQQQDQYQYHQGSQQYHSKDEQRGKHTNGSLPKDDNFSNNNKFELLLGDAGTRS